MHPVAMSNQCTSITHGKNAVSWKRYTVRRTRCLLVIFFEESVVIFTAKLGVST